MKKLWSIFKVRKDLEYAFVLLLLSGLMLATSVFVVTGEGDGRPWDGLLISGTLLSIFLVSGIYFFVGLKGHQAKNRREKLVAIAFTSALHTQLTHKQGKMPLFLIS